MKKLLSIFTAFALVLTLAGCGSEEQGGNETIAIDDVTAEQLKGTEIEFWMAQGGEPGEALQALTDKFNQENEWGIKVTTIYQGGYTDTDQKTTAALSTDKYPNIAMAYGNNIERYRESGKVVCLNDYIDSKWGMTTEEFNDIIPAFREESAAFPDGKIYSLPIGKSTEVLFYNVDFFNEHNLEVPTTWDELLEVSKAATAITGKPSFGYDSLDNYFITYLQQLGGQYTDEKGDILFREGESYEAAIEVLEKFEEGWDAGAFTFKQEAYMSDLFNSNQLPMFIGSTSGTAYIKIENWSAAPLPTMGEMKVMQQGAPVCVLDNGTVENVAAYLFVEFLMEAENTAYYSMNSGYVPVRTSTNEVPEYKAFLESGKPAANVKKVFAEYPDEVFIYDAIFQDSYAFRKECGKAIERVCLEDMEPKASIDQLIKSIDAI